MKFSPGGIFSSFVGRGLSGGRKLHVRPRVLLSWQLRTPPPIRGDPGVVSLRNVSPSTDPKMVRAFQGLFCSIWVDIPDKGTVQ